MAATHKTVPVPAGDAWALLNTEGAITGDVSIYALDHPVWIKATATLAAPTSTDGAIVLWPQAAIINTPLADLFPGLSGPVHVYAHRREAAASVTISAAG